MPSLNASELKAARENVVRDHMRLENEAKWDEVLATFAHPRYEFQVPNKGSDADYKVFDGAEQVLGYFRSSRTPFPAPTKSLVSGHTLIPELCCTNWA